MTRALIQFRLSDSFTSALKSLAQDGESDNLVAKRLIEELLLPRVLALGLPIPDQSKSAELLSEAPSPSPSKLEAVDYRLSRIEEWIANVNERVGILEVGNADFEIPELDQQSLEKKILKIVEENIDSAVASVNQIFEDVQNRLTTLEKGSQYGVDQQVDQEDSASVYNLTSICLGRICPQCEQQALGTIDYDDEVLFECNNCDWQKVFSMRVAVEAGYEDLDQVDREINESLKGVDQEVDQFVDSDLPLFPGLTQAELARHLKVHPSQLTRRRSRSDFEVWSASKDPDRSSWRWANDLKIFEKVSNK